MATLSEKGSETETQDGARGPGFRFTRSLRASRKASSTSRGHRSADCGVCAAKSIASKTSWQISSQGSSSRPISWSTPASTISGVISISVASPRIQIAATFTQHQHFLGTEPSALTSRCRGYYVMVMVALSRLTLTSPRKLCPLLSGNPGRAA